jgi:signal transduction histidine kinase
MLQFDAESNAGACSDENPVVDNGGSCTDGHRDCSQRIRRRRASGAKFRLNGLADPARNDPSQRIAVAEVDKILRDVIGMSRDLSHELSPAVFYQNDLAEVIEWLADHMKADQGLVVHLSACGHSTLESESLTIFLFRVARELLSNVVRHAGVHEARVRLRRMGRYVALCVSDRGCGFDLRSLEKTSGYGLLSIVEQVELLGGRMTIKTIPGKGSKLRTIMPDVRRDDECTPALPSSASLRLPLLPARE